MATTDNNRLSAQATVHTYRCNDGIVRTRCQEHMAHAGPYAPARHVSQLSSIRTDDRAAKCIECYYAQFVRSTEA